MRIDHINFNVSNLNKSVEFYTKIFELSVKEKGVSESSGSPYIILGHPDKFYLCLYQSDESTKQGGFNHFGINVEEFDEMLERLKKYEIEIQYGGVAEWPKSKSAYILGPDGEEIEITEYFGGKLN